MKDVSELSTKICIKSVDHLECNDMHTILTLPTHEHGASLCICLQFHGHHSWWVGLLITPFLCKVAWCLRPQRRLVVREEAFMSVLAQGPACARTEVHGVFSIQTYLSTSAG